MKESKRPSISDLVNESFHMQDGTPIPVDKNHKPIDEATKYLIDRDRKVSVFIDSDSILLVDKTDKIMLSSEMMKQLKKYL